MLSENFLNSYIETALWSSTDMDGTPLDDEKYADTELADETRERMRKDCEDLITLVSKAFDFFYPETPDYPVAHDFWLTRNGHGAGFWDGDYPGLIGKALTDIAHTFPECNLYVGDDGKFYIS